MNRYLLLLLIPLSCFAQQRDILMLPENPRVMGIGGAFAAVADDPQAGFLNPAYLQLLTKLGSDLSYSAYSDNGPDHLVWAVANPGTESGATFAMGMWTQGLLAHRDRVYYVPYTGTSWNIGKTAAIGLVTRFPYLSSRVDSEKSRWETVADVSARMSLSTMRLGASVERTFGGASGIIPRKLRVGAALVSQSGITVSYEWRGNETRKRFDFHFESSHYGLEISTGKYLALRGGFVDADVNRFAFGGAIGLLKAGWRVESAYELPASDRGQSRWSVGLCYRN